MPVKLVPACFKPGTRIQGLRGFLDSGQKHAGMTFEGLTGFVTI
jgi:hypothetical protein